MLSGVNHAWPVERTPVEWCATDVRVFLLISQNWEAYQALSCIFVNEITKFWANIKYEEDLRYLRLWKALRLCSGAYVFLANFSEMADFSGKRHAYL